MGRGRTAVAVAASASLALAGCEWVQPFEQICEKRLAPTSIRVSTAPINERVDLSKSVNELTALGVPMAGRQVLGLTQTQLRWGVSYTSRGLTRPLTGRHCMRPAIELKLAFDPMTVLVGR